MTQRIRRTSRISLVCALTLLSCTYAAAATPPRVIVSADRQTATVGDPIEVTIRVDHRRDWKHIPQPLQRTLGAFDVLGDTSYIKRWGEGDDRLRYERHLKLAVFRPGGFWIPSLSGQIIDTNGESTAWQSDSLAIMIESVLERPDADTTDIAGLKGPYVAPDFSWYWWISVALALIAVGAYIWYRRRQRAAVTIAKAPPIPPWEVALRELSRLRKEVQPELDGGRLWYFRLSETLRRYWDGRYGWQTIDQTTTEIVRQLPQAPFSTSHRERAEEFLRLADRVRYAKHPATEGRPEVDWEWVRAFVNDTIPLRIVSDDAPVRAEEEVVT